VSLEAEQVMILNDDLMKLSSQIVVRLFQPGVERVLEAHLSRVLIADS